MKARVRMLRRSYTKAIPEGATISRQRGKGGGKVATWSKTKADGSCEVLKAPVTSKGDRIKCWSKHWFLTFTDSREVQQTIQAFDSELASRTARDKLHELLDHRAAGVAAPTAEAWFCEPGRESLRAELVRVGLMQGPKADQEDPGMVLDDLICEFERHLLYERERKATHVASHVSVLRRAFGACGFKTWDNIDADAIKGYLSGSRKAGWSKRTVNAHVQALRQFGKYVVEERELANVDPMRKLKRLDKQGTDKRRSRRILSPEELSRVLQAARIGPERIGLSGPDRALLYWFMASTGLRRGECSSLVVSDLHLSGLNPCVKLDGRFTKNGNDAEQPLGQELAEALKAYVSHKLPAATLFGFRAHLCQAWQDDMKRADVDYVNASGEYADIHGLRHYYATQLVESGLSIDEVKRLMRHGSIVTTQRYFHADAARLRRGVESLPSLSVKSA